MTRNTGPGWQDKSRLVEAVLKWAGATLLLVSCALLVYLSAVLFARGMTWMVP